MNAFSSSKEVLQRYSILITVTLCIALGAGLSIFSLLEACTDACAESQKYTLFGQPFALSGLIFFSIAAMSWIYTLRNPKHLVYLSLLFSVGLGSELFFLYVQKYWMGKWCPVCLGVFAIVAFLWLFLTLSLIQRPASSTDASKSLGMRAASILISSFAALSLGFFTASFGVSRPELAEAQTIGKDAIYFGNPTSSLEMYIFTDWFCPACRKAEPNIEQQASDIAKRAKIFFIDVPFHESSMNYVPYNLSFMLKEKTEYLNLRHQLTKLAERKKAPSEHEIEAIAMALGVEYQQLDYAQVNHGIQYFKEVAARYGVDNTPTVVLVNSKTKRMKKLQGTRNIKSANFLQLLEELSAAH